MRWIAIFMAGILLLGSNFAVFAQPAATPSGTGRIAAAFDRLFGPNGKVRHTGAVIAVVENGRIVTLKAYGHADAA
jgi:CubicO group peptidase (beta-lactamase class C family)